MTKNLTKNAEAYKSYKVVVEGKTIATCVSGSTKVATADNAGNIETLKDGTAKITVTTTDKKKVTLTLKVTDPYLPTKVAVAQGTALTVNLDEPVTLKAALTPETARTALTWTSGSKAVATIDDAGLVTPLKPGKTTVTVKTANNKKATIKLTVVDPHVPTGVTISNGAALTVNLGEKLALNAVVAPAAAKQEVTWTTSSKTIAAVDEKGVVSLLKTGKATITAKTYNNKKATIKLTVIDPYVPTGVTIQNGAALTVNVGDKLALNAVVAPAAAKQQVTWSTSSKAIAAVDEKGVVSLLKTGKATITAKTYNNKKATIKLTVIDPYVPTGVTISNGAALTLYEGETAQLRAVVAPSTARQGVTWTSGSQKVAAVDAGGFVTALKAGTTKITVKTTNSKKATITVTVKKGSRPLMAMMEDADAEITAPDAEVYEAAPEAVVEASIEAPVEELELELEY